MHLAHYIKHTHRIRICIFDTKNKVNFDQNLKVQSFAKDWRIFIVVKTWKMRQSLACQSLACHFLTAFSGIFLVQKLTFINFGGILKMIFYEIRWRNHNFWSKSGLCGINRVAELFGKWFWPKIGDFDKAHQEILEFWKFREFLENASIFGGRLYLYFDLFLCCPW